MHETLLHGLNQGGIMVSILDSGRTEHSHWPIPMVWTGTECYKFQSHYMPTGHTPVRDVRGGRGTAVHGNGCGLPQADENTGLLPILWSGNYRGFNDVTHMSYAWCRAGNLL